MKTESNNFNFEIDKNNRFVLDMLVMDESGFISPYCSNLPVISGEAAAYLENAVKNIPIKFDISLHVKCSGLSQNKQELYRNSIKNYFNNTIQQTIRDLFRTTMIALVMAIIGIGVIVLMLILTSKGLGELWNIVLEIIGWVFIWESVDKFFFERQKLKHELRRAYQFINADIQFIDITNQIENIF